MLNTFQDGDGTLDKEEFRNWYKDSAAFTMFEVTDTDVDGFVTRDELRSFLKRWGMADEAIQGRYSVLS